MDGLSIRNSQRLLETGQTQSEMRTPRVGTPSTTQGESFSQTLSAAFNDVNRMQLESDRKMQDLAVGKNNNIADVMTTAEKADIALRLMTQVRNKIIEAYQEIMKMQV